MSLPTTYTIANLQNDAVTLSTAIQTALTEVNPERAREAWIAAAISSAQLTAGMAELVDSNPSWAGWVGPAATFASLTVSARNLSESLQRGQDAKAADVLGVVGAISDISGGLLLKPGPQVVAALVLKGIALGTSVAQNIVGDATIAELVGNSSTTHKPVVPDSLFPPAPSFEAYAPDGVTPLNTPISLRSGNAQVDVIWIQRTDGSYEKSETVTMQERGVTQSVNFTQYRYDSDGAPVSADTYRYGKNGDLLHQGTLAPALDGQSWIVGQPGIPEDPQQQVLIADGPHSHSIVLATAATLSAILIAAKNAGNDISLADLLAANPQLAGVHTLDAGAVLYVPQRQMDGSITYFYEGGTHINNNAATGEYDMTVQADDGSWSVYTRSGDTDTGYVVTQTDFNAAGEVLASHTDNQPGMLGDREEAFATYEAARVRHAQVVDASLQAVLAGDFETALSLVDEMAEAAQQLLSATERWAPFMLQAAAEGGGDAQLSAFDVQTAPDDTHDTDGVSLWPAAMLPQDLWSLAWPPAEPTALLWHADHEVPGLLAPADVQSVAGLQILQAGWSDPTDALRMAAQALANIQARRWPEGISLEPEEGSGDAATAAQGTGVRLADSAPAVAEAVMESFGGIPAHAEALAARFAAPVGLPAWMPDPLGNTPAYI